jgi:drug/metabolite transporter (DMT)-like permease
MTHVAIFAGLPGIIIVIERLVFKVRVTKFEVIGSIVALGGCIVTSLDFSAEKVDNENTNILFGDFLALISAIFATFYI